MGGGLLGNGGVFLVFGLWGAPVALLVFGSGLFLTSLFDIRHSTFDILLVEEVDSLAGFAS